MTSDEEKIAEARSTLDEDGKRRHEEAIGEGYKDEVCSECGITFLAFHHFLYCQSTTCPMKARDPKGDPKPTILEQLLLATEVNESPE